VTAPTTLLAPRVLIPFVVATLIWGSTWLVIRDQLGVVPPTWSVTYRFVIGAVAMFAYASLIRVPLDIGRQGQIFAALFGFAQFVLNFNFVYRAEGHITSGLVAVVFALLIVPNSLFGRLLLGTPLSRRLLIGSAIAVIGVALLIVQEARADQSTAADTVLGFALTIGGILSASAANIMQATQRARALPMVAVLAWGMVWGSAINAAIALATVGWPIVEPRTTYLLGTAYLGVFASAIAFSCYFVVIRAVGPAQAAYSGVLVPVLAMLLSTMFEGYRWTALAAGGSVLVVAGLAVALSARRPAT